MSKLNKSSVFHIGKTAFLMLYTVLFTLYSIALVHADDSLSFAVPYALCMASPIFLLMYDFFCERHFCRIPYVDVITLFFIVLLLSCLVNRQYGLVENLKSVAWMAFQVYLLCSINPNTGDRALFNTFKLLSNPFIVMQTGAVLLSLAQFLTGTFYTVDVVFGGVPLDLRIGFVSARLFGIFTDPNYATIASLIALGFIAYNWFCSGLPKWTRILYAFAAFFLFCYCILSGSRTGFLLLLAVSFLVGGSLFVIKLPLKAWAIRVVSFVVIGALSAGLTVSVFETLKSALSHAPGLYYSIMYPDDLYDDGDTTTTTTTTTTPSSSSDTTTSSTTVSTTPSTRPTRPPAPEINFDRGDVDDDVSNNRFTIWKDCLTLVKTSPLFGTGPRTHLEFAEDHFDDMYIVGKGYSVHNGYLALFVGSGILGGVLMLVWLVLILIHVIGYLIRRANSRDQYYWPVFICTAILAVEAISAFPFMALFFCNEITDILFWIVLGFTFTFIYKSEPERYQKPSLIGKLLNGIFGKLRSLFTKKPT